MNDAAKRGQVGTPGALAERDAQVFRAGIHLNRLNNEFEDFLFGRIDLLLGKDGKKGPDGAYTAVEPAEGAVRDDRTADIAETLHIGRIGVLDSEYAPLVIDWRAPAAAPFYRSTPVDPGRVVRRRVIRSKGRRVLGVEDDLMRPELTAFLDGEQLAVIGDGALMAALGQARSHTMRDIVASIQAEQDLVIRAPAASVTYVEGGPGTGKTAVALHRAAYLLYQDRRRYAGGILIVSPTPLLVAYTEGVLPSLGEEGQVAIRAIGSLVDGAEATLYDSPAVARAKGSYRMLRVLRKAARGALEVNDSPTRLRVVAFGRRLELEAADLERVRQNALSGTAPVNMLRPRARKLLLDALWERSGSARPAHGPRTGRRTALVLRRGHRERGRLHRLPRRLVARTHPARRPGVDVRRTEARPLGPAHPQPRRGPQGRPRAEAGRTLGPRRRDPRRTPGDPRHPGPPPQAARPGPAGPAHRSGGADARTRGVAARTGRAARPGARRVRARHRGRGPGPHPDAVAHGRPPRPATPPGRSSATRPSPPGPTPTRPPRPATRPSAPAPAAASPSRSTTATRRRSRSWRRRSWPSRCPAPSPRPRSVRPG